MIDLVKRPTLRDLSRPPWLTAGTVVVLATALMSVGDTPAHGSTEAVVRRGDVTATVSAAGNVRSADTRELVFGTSGTVSEVDVRPGDKVKAGQTLARLDDGPAKEQVQVAKAALTAAQDAYDKAQQGICTGGAGGGGAAGARGAGAARTGTSPRSTRTTRTAVPSPTRTSPRPKPKPTATPRPSSPSPSPSPTPYPTHHPTGSPAPTQRPGGSRPTGAPFRRARSGGGTGGGCPPGAVQQAAAKVTQANIQVRQAERTLAATTLKAPMSGTVLAVGGTVGDQVGAASRTGFITLGDLDDLQVRAMFSLGDVQSLRIGQPATVTFAVSPGGTYTGTIVGIDPAATTSGKLVQYGVDIALDDSPPHLLVGMSATVEVVTAQADDALYVPVAAVRARHGDTATVLVRSGGRTVNRTVTLGVRGDRYVAITRGLAAGDRVLVPSVTGPDGFPDGSFPAT
jgi:HlyD family secretion protein